MNRVAGIKHQHASVTMSALRMETAVKIIKQFALICTRLQQTFIKWPRTSKSDQNGQITDAMDVEILMLSPNPKENQLIKVIKHFKTGNGVLNAFPVKGSNRICSF